MINPEKLSFENNPEGEGLVNIMASLYPEINDETIKKTEEQLKVFYDKQNVEKKYTIGGSTLLSSEEGRMYRIDMFKLEGREGEIKDLEILLRKIICEEIEKNETLKKEKKEDIKSKIQKSSIKELLKLLEIIKNSDESHKEADLFEKVKTVILKKFLGNDFFIVRSSEYDDIKNGIDNIIYEKTTGIPLCAIDVLLSGKQDTRDSKITKVLKLDQRGGTKIEFGFDIKDGKILGFSPGVQKNIPVVSIAANREQFRELLNESDFSQEKFSSKEEKFFYDNIVSAFAFQFEALKKNIPSFQKKERENLKEIRKKFDPYFERMIEYYKNSRQPSSFIKQVEEIINASAEN